MSELKKRASQLFSHASAAYAQLYKELVEMRDLFGKADVSQEDRVDAMYCIREAAERLGAMNRALGQTMNGATHIICAVHMLKYANRMDQAEPIRGEWATGSPDVKLMPKIPTKDQDPVAFSKLCKHFGVPEALIEKGMLGFYWPKMVDYVTALAAEGKPMPDGMSNDMGQRFHVVIRSKRDAEANAVGKSDGFDVSKLPDGEDVAQIGDKPAPESTNA